MRFERAPSVHLDTDRQVATSLTLTCFIGLNISWRGHAPACPAQAPDRPRPRQPHHRGGHRDRPAGAWRSATPGAAGNEVGQRIAVGGRQLEPLAIRHFGHAITVLDLPALARPCWRTSFRRSWPTRTASRRASISASAPRASACSPTASTWLTTACPVRTNQSLARSSWKPGLWLAQPGRVRRG